VIDMVPTMLELAGIEASPTAPIEPMPGTSLIPTFATDTGLGSRSLWWAHDGHRAFRDGDWKLVALEGGEWELYDLANDQTEQNDLARILPERVRDLTDRWQVQADHFVQLSGSKSQPRDAPVGGRLKGNRKQKNPR